MRNVSDAVVEKIKTHIVYSTFNTHCVFNILFPENRTTYKVMWKKVQPGRPQTTV